MKPRMFIGSSKEQLDLAYAAQEGLEHDVEATVWTQGVFQLSKSSVASIIDILEECDFGLFILAPDDVSKIRGKTSDTVRDNVIFEVGLFAGKLGIERCFMIVPNGADDLHLPSDLLGLTPATYEPDRQDKNLIAALGPACNRIRKAVAKLGKVKPIAVELKTDDAPEETGLVEDQNDCVSLIQSWMGSRSMSANRQAIRYAEVDKILKLKPGSAEKYIEEAARHYDYVPLRKGKDTIIFTDSPSGGGGSHWMA